MKQKTASKLKFSLL